MKYEHGLMCSVVLLLYYQFIVTTLIVSQTVIFRTVGINQIYTDPKLQNYKPRRLVNLFCESIYIPVLGNGENGFDLAIS